MSSSNNKQIMKALTEDLTYEEKLKLYELLLALRQNQQHVESRPA